MSENFGLIGIQLPEFTDTTTCIIINLINYLYYYQSLLLLALATLTQTTQDYITKNVIP
jgi:hypothetical protein